MHPAILPAALAFSAATAMAAYVALRRDKSELHWLLLAVLGCMMVWTMGSMVRFSVESVAGLRASLHLVFLGVFALPPFWFLLSAHFARARAVTERRSLYPFLLVPSALAYLALVTNDAHHLVIREVSFEALESGGRAWAGPVFWAALGWCYLCVVAGAVLYLRSARHLVANDERRRALLLASAAVIPVLASLVYLLRLLPVSFDLTPAGLVVSISFLTAATFRYQLLESLPLARRDVIEHLTEGVLVANAAGTILDTNPAAERILGCSEVELCGRPLAEALGVFIGGKQGPVLRADLDELASSPRPLLFEFTTYDERTIVLHAAGVRDARGEPAGQFAVLRDRTEERRYERVAQQTQRLETVGTLAAGIAHEVNNPLAFIRSNLSQLSRMGETVQSHADGPDAKLASELSDLYEIAEETLDGIDRIERIVADMRMLSNGGQQEERVPVDANAVVADALRLANLSRDHEIEVREQLSDGLPCVYGSPQRLVQAVLNLLVNARQALAETRAPRVELVTLVSGDSLEIRVRDNGPGIPPHVRQRVFDPFFTTKDPDEGTGLGLAIAFDILRDQGGALEVASNAGPGTTFTAKLPLPRD